MRCRCCTDDVAGELVMVTPTANEDKYLNGQEKNVDHYELWLCWRSIMLARDEVDG